MQWEKGSCKNGMLSSKIGNEVTAQGIDDRSYSISQWMENLNNCTSVGIETASSKAW